LVPDALTTAKGIVADVILRDAPAFDVAQYVEDTMCAPNPRLGEANWERYMRGELAIHALFAVACESKAVSYEVTIGEPPGIYWEHFRSRRFTVDEPRLVNEEPGVSMVTTEDIDDVRYLLCWQASLCGPSSLAAVLRSPTNCAGIMYDWDEERFYFAGDSDLLERHIVSTARFFGLDVVEDPGPSYVATSPEDYLAFRSWIQDGASGPRPPLQWFGGT
jgi:hypothetical protein